MKHRLKCGRSFSVGAQWTSTDTSEKEKKKLTGQVNVPLSTKSKSQTFTECENIEEIKDADVSIYNPVIQSKAVPQACWNCDTHAPWEVPTWAQNTNSYNPNNSYNSPKHRPSRCLSVPPCSHSITSVADSPCSGRNMTVSQSGEALKYDTNAFFMKPETIPDVECKHPFIPDINADDLDDKTYRFQCSSPGLYKCSVTGLVFVMKGEGDVAYRCVPWNRRLLAQHHKKPAGPLFDIKCQQQSVCQLHLPHCEILSTGGGQFLQVAHVNDEGIEFIPPHTITETHVVVNITGFSGYGNVKDEDSPPDPVRALVLLFYRPPENPDLTSFLSVLLLPRNVVLRDVLHTRKRANRNERYIDIPAECKLHPKQVYTLFTAPDDDLIKVQPQEKDFDEEYHDTYFTSFQVILKRVIGDINLSLREKTTSICVWESEVCLLLTRVRTLTSPSDERLLNVRSCFTDGISGPVLNSLLDKLLDKNVITDAEKEAADVMNNRTDKARFVIDTVRRKGEAASSEMIEVLSKLDPFLCRHLGFVQGMH